MKFDFTEITKEDELLASESNGNNRFIHLICKINWKQSQNSVATDFKRNRSCDLVNLVVIRPNRPAK